MSGAEADDALHRQQIPLRRRRRLLVILLGLTLARGIVYLAVLPPWQHYDEPTHFEYVRLIALRRQIPNPGEYDLRLRQEIAASMQATDFWKDSDAPSFGYWADEPPNIGVSELSHPPLYYALQAIPQLLVSYQGVETQLYVARLGSVLLYVVVVASSYGVVAEAFPRRRWFPLVVATFIALLPPLADLMSGVNNDAGAAAAASLFLWATARIVRRGPSPERCGVALLLAAICVATKSTAGAVAIVVLTVLWLSHIPWPKRKWIWAAVAVLIPAALAVTLTWNRQAAYWYSGVEQSAPNRLVTEAPLGRAVFVLSAGGESYPRSVFQELDRQVTSELEGHTVTLGAWLRAADGAGGYATLSLYDGHEDRRLATTVSEEWEFHAFTATVGTAAPGIVIRAEIPTRESAAREVYVDGLVLVDGEMPIGQPHRFTTTHGERGQWGPHQFANLLKNGSAEQMWPGLRSWAREVSVYRKPIAWILQSVLDWQRNGWVYGREIWVLFGSFWGRFGWSHLALPGPWFYPLLVLTLLALGGAAIGLVRRFRSSEAIEPWQWRLGALFAIALAVGWGGAVLRIHPVFTTWQVFWPVARYAVVVIIPTAALVCWGLGESVPRRWHPAAAWLGLLGLLVLDSVALWTVILPYYYG